MVVHGVIAFEHLEEVLRADRNHQRQTNRGRQRITASNPVPEREHVRRVDAEFLDLFFVGRQRNEMPRHSRLVFQSVQKPFSGGSRVGHGFQSRKRLAGDDKQRFLGVEVANRFGKMRPVNIGDESNRQLSVRIRFEGFVRHDRTEVRAADADIDDVLNPLAGIALPFAGTNLVGELRHVIENRIDVVHDVFTVNKDRRIGTIAKRNVQHCPLFRQVDFLAGEHLCPHGFNAGLTGKVNQRAENLSVNPVFGKVERQTAGGLPKRGRARRVGGKQFLEGNVFILTV